MIYMLVRHKVKDYDKWKIVFDEHADFRKKGGEIGGRLFRNAENPNETIIVFKWESIQKAKEFAMSEDLRKAMEKAGVSDKPDIYFLDYVEKLSE